MKKYDVVATLGTYEKDGEKKYVSRNVGVLMDGEKGLSLKLDATFNPAGCVRREDGSVWLGIFEQKAKDDAPKAKSASKDIPFDSEIPF